jgi:long-chain acyl-CoA synthetase
MADTPIHNVYQQFASTAERSADRIAIELQRRNSLERSTYQELRARADTASAFLASSGIAAGDHCAIFADNDIAWCAAYLGILQLGAVAVPFDTHYTAQQISILLRDSAARMLFTTPRYLSLAKQGLQIDSCAADLVLLYGSAPGTRSLEGAHRDSSTPLPPCNARRGDPAVVLYTSGTTSDPKGVVLTHGNLLSEAEAAFQVVHLDEHDSVLGILPLFHALAQAANLVLPFLVGARVIFLEEPNTSELLRALRERQPTAFCCVPKFFYLIHERVFREAAKAGWLRALVFRFSLRTSGLLRRYTGINVGKLLFRRIHSAFGRKMRILVTGGARFETSIGRDFQSLGFSLIEAYGLTESSGAATLTRPGEGGLGTVGLPLPGVEIKIFPVVEMGEEDARIGEVAIRGPIVMQGYLNRPAATREAMQDDWFLTGDLGYLNPDGRLTITGRKKEVIVLSSGKKVYPEEVETHYAQSPYIKELCILGMPSPGKTDVEGLHGIIVPNFEVMRARKVLNVGEVLRFEIENLSIHLPSHKRILSYEIWTETLPRTTTNKLKRFEIERLARARQEKTAEEPAATMPLSAEDAAWSADSRVSRALEVVREATRHKHAIRPDANLELDLGLDSIERVELLTNLQLLFGARIPDEAAKDIYTVRQLIAAVLTQHPGVVPAGESGNAWQTLLRDLPQEDPVFRDLLTPHPFVLLMVFATLKMWRLLARWLLGFHVTGLEHLPARGPFLLCPNHQSYLDPFLLVSALPFRTTSDIFFVGASEYFATPFRRAAARLMRIVPVDPDTNLVRAMQAGAFGLRHGKILVLFPEGERSIDGKVKNFKKGVAILSTHLETPVVPAAFDGMFDVWPRNRALRWSAFLPWKRTRVHLRFGQVLSPPTAPAPDTSAQQLEGHYARFAEHLRKVVAEMQLALRRDSAASSETRRTAPHR